MCNCATGDETTEQYLVLCPLFGTQRSNLLNDLSRILQGETFPSMNLLTQIILYGSPSYSEAINRSILALTIKYIKETNRFKSISS